LIPVHPYTGAQRIGLNDKASILKQKATQLALELREILD